MSAYATAQIGRSSSFQRFLRVARVGRGCHPSGRAGAAGVCQRTHRVPSPWFLMLLFDKLAARVAAAVLEHLSRASNDAMLR